MSQHRMDIVCSRVFDFIQIRAAQSKTGLVQVSLEEIVETLRRRFPTGERVTIGEAHEALRLLKLRRKIVGHTGFWRIVQQASSTGTPCPPVPT